MSTNYEFNTSSYSSEELSVHFAGVLGLDRAEGPASSTMTGEAWWVSSATMSASEFADEAARLGAAGSFASITFVPKKSISWQTETLGLVKILRSVVDLLTRDPGHAGFFEFYDEIIVLEKRRGSQIVVDPRLVDPNDLDDLRAFEPVFGGFTVAPIGQL